MRSEVKTHFVRDIVKKFDEGIPSMAPAGSIDGGIPSVGHAGDGRAIPLAGHAGDGDTEIPLGCMRMSVTGPSVSRTR